MSKRRDPFASSETPNVPPNASVYDSLRVAEERTRNRQWERDHQNQKVVYRGVEPKLALKVKNIAGELHVPEGEVARALIEHALRAYERSELDLCPRPDPERIRMTLFPSSDSARFSSHPKKSKHHKGGWRVITTWRGFPPELKGELSALASDAGLNVPIGELITALLRHGLQAYESGLLKLEAVPAATTFTLAQEGQK
ncbi:MAG: hypothetical protein DPW21_00870 [Anaerolineae bacterium]|nr:hypothetical protein [Chloroflexi bacterium CFX2]MCQ3945232.1 hypothetical protein [Anaerolineae bacterium]MCZ7547574.1 hypothetical protein [Anaerolineales bacterium]GER79078.1 conserved hypothetical protein [Candidatus Denitrolinea symbiosum]HPO85076.1 hypothetical protein [Candidatus Hydrogenedentota bacterium]